MEITEGTVYGIPYKLVCPRISLDMSEWLVEQFGIEGLDTIQARWYYKDFHLWFRDEEDLTLFLLRWS